MSHAVAKAEALKSWVHLHEPICAVLRWGLLVGLARNDESGHLDRCDALGVRKLRTGGGGAMATMPPDTRIGHRLWIGDPKPSRNTDDLLKKTRDLLRRIGHFSRTIEKRRETSRAQSRYRAIVPTAPARRNTV